MIELKINGGFNEFWPNFKFRIEFMISPIHEYL